MQKRNEKEKKRKKKTDDHRLLSHIRRAVVKALLALNEFCDLSHQHTHNTHKHTRTYTLARRILWFDFSHCTLVSCFARRYSKPI